MIIAIRITRTGGSFFHNPVNPFDDVVNIRKIALHIAVVEDPDRSSGNEFIGCGKIEHIRASCRSVHRKKTQSRAWDIVKLRVGVRQKFVCLFGCRIQRNGVIRLVIR